MKIMTIIMGALLLTAAPSSFAEQAQLRLGTGPGYPPFEYKTPDGTLTGFDIELGNAICAKLNRQCVWITQPFDSLVAGLKARKFDAIQSGLTVTERRRQVLDFTRPVYAISSQLVARRGNPIDGSLPSLQGKRIGVLQGSVQADYARAHWRDHGVKIVAYQDQSQTFNDLVTGRLDGAFMEKPNASTGLLDRPEGKDFEFVGKPFVQDPALNSDVALGLRKGSQELKRELDGAIEALQKDGTAAKIAQKYFKHGGVTLLQPNP